MGEFSDIVKNYPRAPAFFLTLLSTFVLGLLLLFFKELTPKLQDWLVPSLVIYVLGTGLIAVIHLFLYLRTDATPKRISGWKLFWILTVHVVWFLALIAYNCFRIVL